MLNKVIDKCRDLFQDEDYDELKDFIRKLDASIDSATLKSKNLEEIRATLTHYKGQLLGLDKEYVEASKYYKNAAELFEKIGKADLAADNYWLCAKSIYASEKTPNVSAMYHRAYKNYLSSNQNDLAARSLVYCAKFQSESRKNVPAIKNYFIAGSIYFKHGLFEEAHDAYKEAIILSSQNEIHYKSTTEYISESVHKDVFEIIKKSSPKIKKNKKNIWLIPLRASLEFYINQKIESTTIVYSRLQQSYRDIKNELRSYGLYRLAEGIYLEEMDILKQSSSGWKKLLLKFFKLNSKYGTSPGRFATCGIIMLLFFSVIYCPTPSEFEKFVDWAPFRPILMDVKYNNNIIHNFIESFYFSTVVFTTLGFGDIKPKNDFCKVYVTIEVIIGYLMLGTLLALVATKLRSY